MNANFDSLTFGNESIKMYFDMKKFGFIFATTTTTTPLGV